MNKDRFTVEIEQRQAESDKALALGIVALVAQNPHIEFEIVRNFCKRNGRVLMDKAQSDAEFYRKYPQFK